MFIGTKIAWRLLKHYIYLTKHADFWIKVSDLSVFAAYCAMLADNSTHMSPCATMGAITSYLYLNSLLDDMAVKTKLFSDCYF